MASKIEQYSAVGEIVSAVAVVVSVLFLAYQVRENTEMMRITAAAESRDSLAHTSDLILNFRPELLELMERSFSAETSVNDLNWADQVLMMSFQRSFVRRAEAQFFRYQAGLLDQDVWETVRGRVILNMGSRVWREIWKRESRLVYTTDFIAEIENHLPDANLE